MATQKKVQEHLKAWQEATDMKSAMDEAEKAAKEFDGLYEESAANMLERTPDLMLLLSAYIAGRESVQPVEPEQGALV